MTSNGCNVRHDAARRATRVLCPASCALLLVLGMLTSTVRAEDAELTCHDGRLTVTKMRHTAKNDDKGYAVTDTETSDAASDVEKHRTVTNQYEVSALSDLHALTCSRPAEWSLVLGASFGSSTHRPIGSGFIGARYQLFDMGFFVAAPNFHGRDFRQSLHGIAAGLTLASFIGGEIGSSGFELRAGPVVSVGRASFCTRECTSGYDGYLIEPLAALKLSSVPKAYAPSWGLGLFLGAELLAVTTRRDASGTSEHNETDAAFVAGVLAEISYGIPDLSSGN